MSRVKKSLDHKRIRRLVWLVLTVSVLLGYSLQSVAGSAYYSMLMQAYGTVSSPPVILEEGNVSGTSTIYTNKTSAKVSVAAPRDWWNTDYGYRRRISIVNNVASTLGSGYSVCLTVNTTSLVSSGKMLPSGNDLRIVYGSWSSWVEINRDVIDMNTSSTKVWFKTQAEIDSSATDKNYYMYYGNPSAGSPPANKSEVYLWFDDFSTNTTNNYDINRHATDWHGLSNNTYKPYWDSANNAVYFDTDNDYVGGWMPNAINETDVYAEMKMNITGSYPTNTTNGILLRWQNNDTFYGGHISGDSYTSPCLVRNGRTTNIAYASPSEYHAWNQWFTLAVAVWGSNLKLWVDGVLKVNGTDTQIAASGKVSFLVSQSIGWMDDFKIRKYVEPEPSTSLGSEESSIQDYVDNNTSNVDSSGDKGTHSNFTAQQSGPDSVYDTLTEGKGVGATGITPITAFQDTQQSTSSTSLVDANCETSVLSNGVVYLVIYCGNIGGNDASCVAELVLQFGTTTIARCTAEGTDQTAVKHCAAGALQGYYIATGDGTSTLKFQFRCITTSDTAYAGAMGIVAIPLTALIQNSDYWYSVSNTEDVVTNPSTWTNLASKTWNLPETGNYLILMSAEGGCDGSSTADAPMVRFQLNGVTLGSEYMEEWENNNDNMNFAKATVVNCNSGDNNFTIQVRDEDTTSPTADFHRPRIIVIRSLAFDQIVDTSTSTGVSTSSTTYVDWTALTTTYTPNQQEYVVVIANLNGLHHGTYESPVFQIYDATASTAHRVDSGEYGNAGYLTGHAAGADQLAPIAVAVKQQSSATQWKVQIRSENSGTAYYSQNGTGTGHRSDLILWGLSVVTYELDLEVQWTNATYDKTNEELAIYVNKWNNTHSLNATGGYMIVGDGTPNWGSTTGTISLWIKWNTVANRPWGQQENMETRFSGTNLTLDWGATGSLTSSRIFTAGKWYFIAIVWNENTDKLYLYVGDQNNPPTLDTYNNAWTSTVSTVGVTQNNFMASKGGVNPTDGYGDDLRYWDTDRTLAQIQSDYNIELAGSETNLRSYFKLNNNFDDIGPNNNDGSGSGSYSFSSDVPFNAPENIRVDVWTGSVWQNLFTDLASGWNNVSVSSYLTSSTFTIRFKGNTETADTTQDSWNIDATLLHTWTINAYDYVLKVVNQVADNWTVNLQVYDNSNIGRLSSLNISLHDGTSSNQIAVSGGSIIKSEGELYTLPGGVNSTIYISMTNLQATTTGTSSLYVYLKIRVPNSSTYILYVITFEIT